MAEHTYTLELTGKQTVANGTEAFYFKKPRGFTYQAGQSVDLFLIDPPETDAEGTKRAFSLASAPHEAELCVAMRMRDTAFKRVLGSLPLGSTVAMEGPFGSFTLPSNQNTTCAFLIGGIGVTPVRSMLLQAAHDNKTNPLFLFYSNRTQSDAPFFAELTSLAEQNPFYKLIPTITNATEAEGWTGRTGYITSALVQEFLPETSAVIFYLCGPAAMVTAMRTLLESLHVQGEHIRTEEFTGY